MNRKVIITADDYGMCHAVNEAIEECLMAGALHATCVMMNMPACKAAGTLRGRFPQKSIGIHWTLTQGQPVLPPSQVPSLIGANGGFYSLLHFRRRWFMGRLRPAELKAELRAQCERFCGMAGRPDFWTTHENVHIFPGLFELCVALGQELRIPAMRCHRRFTVSHSQTSVAYSLHHPLYWLKGRLIARWSSWAEAQGMLMPDGRVYMLGYAKPDIEGAMKRLQWSSVKKAVELVIHPATMVQEDLFGSLTNSRVLEYETFRNPGFVKRLSQANIEPVGFEVLYNNSHASH